MNTKSPSLSGDALSGNVESMLRFSREPDFLGFCFHVTAFCKTREEIDLLLAMLATAKGFLPDVSAKESK